MTWVAARNITAYVSGYVVRIHAMTGHAKTGRSEIDGRYFAEETLVAAIVLTGLPALVALIGGGPGEQLRAAEQGVAGPFEIMAGR